MARRALEKAAEKLKWNRYKTFFQPTPDVWGKLWKREFLEKKPIRFHNDFSPWEDIHFNAQAVVCSPMVGIIQEPLLAHRIWSASSMRNHGKSIAGFEHLLNSVNASIEILRGAGFPETEIDRLTALKFFWIQCSYYNNYCAKSTENDFFRRLGDELTPENRRLLRRVGGFLPKEAKIFFALEPFANHRLRPIRFFGKTVLYFAERILFPTYLFFYWRFLRKLC